jgi:sterol 3beta-glucosyltransferase
MQLCVKYGMFTPAFIYHAALSFTPWIDELLKSLWIAAQDADLLIEAPTAMGGVHVAEKLGIPYFKAMLYPWTKTTAYAHPFTPSSKIFGGTYNYLTHVTIEQSKSF